jgi:hypothetical protein
MIDNTREYVLCAAIWYKDGTEAPRGLIAQNIDSGVVIGQWRHGNCINIRSTNPLWNAKKLAERKQETPMISSYEDTLKYYEYVDGFLTSQGRFVDRWQGMAIAYLAGQVSYERAKCKNYEGEYVDNEEFLKQVPRHRTSQKDGNGWNMMYSEDIY